MTHLLIDTHCHLHMLEKTQETPEAVSEYLKAAHEAGVGHFICVAVSLNDMPHIMQYVQTYPNVFGSVGIHPNEKLTTEPDASRLLDYALQDKIIAVGETGLDYFRSTAPTWQKGRFEMHIDVAKQSDKPLIVHSRNACEDTLDMIQVAHNAGVRGVWHCFTEDKVAAFKAIDLGFYISFSGIVTFKNAHPIQEAAKALPLEGILLETDCPYLAPVPMRGKPNEPAFVAHTAQAVANLRGVSLAEITQATTENCKQLFGDVFKA